MSNDIPIDEIVCGDNVQVLSTFPDDCIDLVVTSIDVTSVSMYNG